MSIKVTNKKIILEGKTARRFNQLAKTPNIDIVRKRNNYFGEINKTINVNKINDGVRITLKN